ncbi:MAG: biotin/lipoyl-binding protein, partial [Lachnospiraceae bacterium]|nr:biotin/lipoyl-binding protein [Lachnospiraceae bacterium]
MKFKKIIAIVLSVAVGCGAIYGIAQAVKHTTSNNTILVVEAGNFNYGGGWGYYSETEGIVTSDVSQDIYVGNTETVQEVYVTEGQQVKKGDLLISYDRTKTSLALQREQLSHDKIELEIEVAKMNLETLSKLKPISDSPYYPPAPEPEPVTPTPVPAAAKVLDGSAVALNEGEEFAGSDPYFPLRYLLADGGTITADFLAMLQNKAAGGDLYYQIEIHDGDTEDGMLKRA